MIKDEHQIKIKLSYTVLIVGVLVLAIFYLMQWNSTNGLRSVNKQLNKDNETIETLNLELSEKGKQDSLKVIEHKKTIDSLIVLDRKRIYQLNKINQKYEKIKIDYNSAINDDKWDLFSNLINN